MDEKFTIINQSKYNVGYRRRTVKKPKSGIVNFE